jgi:hypothetical protein
MKRSFFERFNLLLNFENRVLKIKFRLLFANKINLIKKSIRYKF